MECHLLIYYVTMGEYVYRNQALQHITSVSWWGLLILVTTIPLNILFKINEGTIILVVVVPPKHSSLHQPFYHLHQFFFFYIYIYIYLKGGLHAAITAFCAWGSFG